MRTTINRLSGLPSGSTSVKRLLILLVLCSQMLAQFYAPDRDPNIDVGDWRTSDQPISFNLAASMSHVAGSAYLAIILEEHVDWWQADLLVLTAGFLWEVKDGYVPWEKAGALGGEGFSSNDLKMDILGITLNRALPPLLDQVFTKRKNSGKSSLKFSATSYPKLLLSMSL